MGLSSRRVTVFFRGTLFTQDAGYHFQICVARGLDALGGNMGEKFTPRNFRPIRPGIGLHTRHLGEVLGRTAAVDIQRGTPLSWELVSR